MHVTQVVSLNALRVAVHRYTQTINGVTHLVVAQSRAVELRTPEGHCGLVPRSRDGQIWVRSFSPGSRKLHKLADPARMPARILH